MKQIKGRIYQTTRSESIECLMLCHSDNSLEIKTENPKIYARSDIKNISDRIGTIPRRLTFTNGVVFETKDNDAVDELFLKQSRMIARIANNLEQWRTRLFFLVIATLIAVFVFIQFAIPFGAKIAAKVTPEIVVQVIDESTLVTIDKAMLSQSNLPQSRRDTLTREFEKLVQIARQLNYPHIENMKLEFRDGNEIGANAFALPGGTIVATDQFIKLAKNNDEIIAVLAHEIGHVRLQHSLRTAYEAIGLYAIIGVIFGGGIDVTQDLISQAAVIFQLSASRSFETEADQFAIELLKASDKNPERLADILKRLTDECKDCNETPQWLSTHPATDERIDHILQESLRTKP